MKTMNVVKMLVLGLLAMQLAVIALSSPVTGITIPPEEPVLKRTYDVLDNPMAVTNSKTPDRIYIPIKASDGYSYAFDVVVTVTLKCTLGSSVANSLVVYQNDQSYAPIATGTPIRTESKSIPFTTYGVISTVSVYMNPMYTGNIYSFQFALSSSASKFNIIDVVFTWKGAISDDVVINAQGFKHDNGILGNYYSLDENGNGAKGWDRVTFIARGVTFNEIKQWFYNRGFASTTYRTNAICPDGVIPENTWWGASQNVNSVVYRYVKTPTGLVHQTIWNTNDLIAGEKRAFRLSSSSLTEMYFYQLRLWEMKGTTTDNSYVIGTIHFDDMLLFDDHSGWIDESVTALYNYFAGWVGTSYNGVKLGSCYTLKTYEPFDASQTTPDKDANGLAVILDFPVYKATVKGTYIKTHGSHDGDSIGEFRIEAKINVDGSDSSYYKQSTHSISSGSYWSGSEVIIANFLVDEDDPILVKLMEVDNDNPDDTIIDWKTVTNSNLHNGGSYYYGTYQFSASCGCYLTVFIEWTRSY
jgi:hypothetical protein